MTPELARQVRDALPVGPPAPTIEESYAAGRMTPPFAPELAAQEYRALMLRSRWPACQMVVRGITSDLDVSGVQHDDALVADMLTTAWDDHLAAAFNALVRAALVSGEGYSILVPDRSRPGYWRPVTRRLSQVYRVWGEIASDATPHLVATQVGDEVIAWESGVCYSFPVSGEITPDALAAGVTSGQLFAGLSPVCTLTTGDLLVNESGREYWSGVVEPLRSANDRLNQATFDLLLVSSFGAVTLRYIAGIDLPEEEDDARERKIAIAVDRILTSSNPDTKFGSLIGTPMEPYIRGVAAALGDLAVQGTVPPNRLLADVENVGAETVANIREGYESMLAGLRKGIEKRLEAHLRAVAVGALGAPDPGPGGWLIWRATELTGVAAVMDAATKAHSIGMDAGAVARKYLPWRVEEIGALLAGYSEARRAQQTTAAASSILDIATRASRPAPGEGDVA